MNLDETNIEKAPAYIVFESIGKTVIRPGGKTLTNKMLEILDISKNDSVVEFAPGAGRTTKKILKLNPMEYKVVERNRTFAKRIEKILNGSKYSCIIGSAQDSQIPDEFATRVFGEAMLTMQSINTKKEIIQEAARILKSGGLYAIHEVGLREEVSSDLRNEIYEDLLDSLKVNAQPITIQEWTTLLKEQNLVIVDQVEVPMKVFSPKSFIKDEGFFHTIKIMSNLLRNKKARKRLLSVRRTFKKHEKNLTGLLLISKKIH